MFRVTEGFPGLSLSVFERSKDERILECQYWGPLIYGIYYVAWKLQGTLRPKVHEAF